MIPIKDKYHNTCLQKYNSHNLSSKGVRASVGEWQTESGRRRQTAKLTHNFYLATLCYLQGLMSSLPMRHTQPVLTRELLGSLQLQFSIRWLNWLLQAGTDRLRPNSHVGICIYHFITPMISIHTMWLLLLIFASASCAKNLWLTAQSRVNMQQEFKPSPSLFALPKYVLYCVISLL